MGVKEHDEQAVPRVVLVSSHHIRSARRAGFHHLAHAFLGLGWEVRFVTTGLSLASVGRRDPRLRLVGVRGVNRVVPVEPGITSFAWCTPWHPANMRVRLLNRLTLPLARAYARMPMRRVREVFGGADLVIFESGPGLFLVPRVREALPGARLVYRQSDNLRAVRAHPGILEAEARALAGFDLVSVTDDHRLRHLPDGLAVAVHRHGIDPGVFDAPSPNPYLPGGRNAVFVGVDGLDRWFLEHAAAEMPDWTFHVIGPFTPRPGHPNIVFHGEMPFGQTVPYVVHADIGLHTIARPMLENFRESLKVLQYTYARLPVVAPRAAAADHPHIAAYDPGDTASVGRAMRAAAAYPREAIDRGMVRTWAEIARDIVRDAGG